MAPLPEGGAAVVAASDILVELERVWTEVVNPHFRQLVEWMWDNGTTGADEEENVSQWNHLPPESRRPASVQLGLVVCAYAVEAIRADTRGEVGTAWKALARGNYWLGFMRGAQAGNTMAALKEGRARGVQKRAETYLRAREWTWVRWQKEKSDYGGKRAAAARDYERLISQEFKTASGSPLKVTQGTLKNVWLKEPPPDAQDGEPDD